MAASVPDWVTAEFFHSCLQSHEKTPLTVTSFTMKPSDIPEGSNYGSTILRVKVDYTKGGNNSSVYLIIKVPEPKSEEIYSGSYDTEAKFYNEFVVETFKYGNHDILPEPYLSPNYRYIVLEDLNISGYKMVDRHNFLDLDHCQLFIKAKAKLHALSVVIYKQNPNLIESLVKKSPIFKENLKDLNKSMIEASLRCMIAYLEDKPHKEEYLNIMKEASKNNKLLEMYQALEKFSLNKPLKVLTQIDPWCTNMMFKYDSLGKVESVKLLDFQGLYFTYPLEEIVTFMNVCPNMEVRRTKTNYLYHLYCDTLNENLSQLGCSERINFEEMKEEIVTLSPFILYLTCSWVPMILAEGAADFSDLYSGNFLNVPIRESSLYKLYQSLTFNKYFPQLLDEISNMGVFDYVKEKMKF